jgi:hypothetical protein
MMFANPTFRRLAFVAFSALAVYAPPASAQDQVINVYFDPPEGSDLVPLNKAIQAAFSQPPLQLAGKPFAGVVVVAVSGKIEVTHKRISGTYYDFIVNFTRDGSSLGESAQSCNGDKLSDCTDQLVQDVKSVATMQR